jgi:hypothetical protein
LPATVAPSGTSRVTTAPAPTTCAGADGEAVQDQGAQANEGGFADGDAAGGVGAGAEGDVVAHHIVMVDAAGGVEHAEAADAGVLLHDRAGREDGPGADHRAR